MKVWFCTCGIMTKNIETAINHTKKDGHIMTLKDSLDNTSRYSVSLKTGS